MNLQEFSEEIKTSPFPVFICGAGISYDVAPLARDIKEGLIEAVIKISELEYSKVSDQTDFDFKKEIASEYLTLELLVSFINYRIPPLGKAVGSLYSRIFSLSNTGAANRAIARAFAKGTPSCILTSNFDDGLYRSLEDRGDAFKIVTNRNITGFSPDKGHICAFHGTVHKGSESGELSLPTTMSARELAHPFFPELATYIKNCFDRASMIVFLGYRVEDHYDLNVCIEDYINEPKSISEREARKKKFYIIPHLGNPDSVSRFALDRFGENLIDLSKDGANWLVKLCDAVSGEKDSDNTSHDPSQVNVADELIKELHLIYPQRKDAATPEGLDFAQLAQMAKALLTDIENGILAVWAASEHYRLESLGLEQSAIKTFGRPSESRKFFDVNVSQVIDLQSRYWQFNKKFRDCVDHAKQDLTALLEGQILYLDMHRVAITAKNCSLKAQRNIDKACCHLIEAIVRDYMGLVGMRHHEWREKGLAWHDEFDRFNRPEFDFQDSMNCADLAGKALSLEWQDFSEHPKYLDNLEKIVCWRIWKIAPKENFARFNIFDHPERFDMLLECIKDRLEFIRQELTAQETSPESVDFSVSGHAAQAALRIGEAMRALNGAGESGPIMPARQLTRKNRDADASFLLTAAKECLEAADKTSSLKNHRLMSVFDARILEALHKGDKSIAEGHLIDAENFAAHGEMFARRLSQLKTRFQ